MHLNVQIEVWCDNRFAWWKGALKDQPSYRTKASSGASYRNERRDYSGLAETGQHRKERAVVMGLIASFSELEQRMIRERFGWDEVLVSRNCRELRQKIDDEPKICKSFHDLEIELSA